MDFDGIDQSKHLSNQYLCKQKHMSLKKLPPEDPNLCGRTKANFDQTLLVTKFSLSKFSPNLKNFFTKTLIVYIQAFRNYDKL